MLLASGIAVTAAKLILLLEVCGCMSGMLL